MVGVGYPASTSRRSRTLGDAGWEELTGGVTVAPRPAPHRCPCKTGPQDTGECGRPTQDGTAATTRRRPRPTKPRQVVLHAHRAADAITGNDRDGYHPARVENGRHLITAEQVREWCGNPDTHVVVKPVIDLAEHIHVSQYEVPDRLADQAEERDLTCVFPWCTRPADGCDQGPRHRPRPRPRWSDRLGQHR